MTNALLEYLGKLATALPFKDWDFARSIDGHDQKTQKKLFHCHRNSILGSYSA
jgi:hypothetical protein